MNDVSTTVCPTALAFQMLGAAHEVEARLESALDRIGLSVAKFGVLAKLVEASEVGQTVAVTSFMAELYRHDEPHARGGTGYNPSRECGSPYPRPLGLRGISGAWLRSFAVTPTAAGPGDPSADAAGDGRAEPPRRIAGFAFEPAAPATCTPPSRDRALTPLGPGHRLQIQDFDDNPSRS